MVGAGKAEGAMDAGNMLKPALARGELHCVGATTLDGIEYIEKDAALERRFRSRQRAIEEDAIAICEGRSAMRCIMASILRTRLLSPPLACRSGTLQIVNCQTRRLTLLTGGQFN